MPNNPQPNAAPRSSTRPTKHLHAVPAPTVGGKGGRSSLGKIRRAAPAPEMHTDRTDRQHQPLLATEGNRGRAESRPGSTSFINKLQPTKVYSQGWGRRPRAPAASQAAQRGTAPPVGGSASPTSHEGDAEGTTAWSRHKTPRVCCAQQGARGRSLLTACSPACCSCP